MLHDHREGGSNTVGFHRGLCRSTEELHHLFNKSQLLVVPSVSESDTYGPRGQPGPYDLRSTPRKYPNKLPRCESGGGGGPMLRTESHRPSTEVGKVIFRYTLVHKGLMEGFVRTCLTRELFMENSTLMDDGRVDAVDV